MLRRVRKLDPRHVSGRGICCIDSSDLYAPMLARWCLAMAIHWFKLMPSKEEWLTDIVFESPLSALTGITVPDGKEEATGTTDAGPAATETAQDRNPVLWLKRLTRRLHVVQQQKVPADVPLVRNIGLLNSFLGMNDTEQMLLQFIVVVRSFRDLYRFLEAFHVVDMDRREIARVLSVILGLNELDVSIALRNDGILRSSGLVEVRQHHSFEDSLDAMDGLVELLMDVYLDRDKLLCHFLRPVGQTALTLEAFPHLQAHGMVLVRYLGSALRQGQTGVNIFLHGGPGTGKTEFVKAMATHLGIELFEVNTEDKDGGSLDGVGRLRAYTMCQRLLRHHGNAALLFDEVEDVLPFRQSRGDLPGEHALEQSAGKAWINRQLEGNPVPAFWLSNSTRMDAAYLRRFHYSIEFPTPPRPVRLAIARHYFGALQPDEAWLERVASHESVTPAQLEQSALVGRVGGQEDLALARHIAEMTLKSSSRLLGQEWALASGGTVPYDPGLLRADVDPVRLAAALQRNPRGSLLFFGPPGTGKSELARYLATASGRPLMAKRASDLLSKYVGDNERNIARMFRQATEQDAVLVLDEADSFLADRQHALHSWEVTLVNEMLTQMESFPGIFIATTNLDSHLDTASSRRFVMKVRFDWLTPEQGWQLFQRELMRLGGRLEDAAVWEPKIRQLRTLAPGDFAVLARQSSLWGEPVTAASLYEGLYRECQAKRQTGTGSIGFVTG